MPVVRSPNSLAASRAVSPMVPGVEMIISLNRCRSMYSITSRNGGKETVCDSYSGSWNVPTGRKFFTSILPAAGSPRQVSTVSCLPVWWAAAASD